MRCDAGLIAGDLGSLPPDLDALVPVPAQALLGYDFRIGKYPVTNHQYRQFIEEGGYDNERWWSAEGLKYKQQNEWTEPRYWRSDRFGRATQPVVGVSWYEAEAYCKWLTNHGRAAGFVGKGEQVRLPTQAEWMAAARHGQPAPRNAAHDYPWQGSFTQSHANTKESNLDQTSPVHMYPLGVTAGGVWDMAGNVWEWRSDLRGSSGAWQKGGSWYTGANRARASAAVDYFRWLRNLFYGFRVVVVPISR